MPRKRPSQAAIRRQRQQNARAVRQRTQRAQKARRDAAKFRTLFKQGKIGINDAQFVEKAIKAFEQGVIPEAEYKQALKVASENANVTK